MSDPIVRLIGMWVIVGANLLALRFPRWWIAQPLSTIVVIGAWWAISDWRWRMLYLIVLPVILLVQQLWCRRWSGAR